MWQMSDKVLPYQTQYEILRAVSDFKYPVFYYP